MQKSEVFDLLSPLISDDFGSDEDNDFGEEEEEEGGSDYDTKRGKKGKKGSRRSLKRKRDAGTACLKLGSITRVDTMITSALLVPLDHTAM